MLSKIGIFKVVVVALLLDLNIVEDDRPSVAAASPSRIPSP
jgi:hypothetical protein